MNSYLMGFWIGFFKGILLAAVIIFLAESWVGRKGVLRLKRWNLLFDVRKDSNRGKGYIFHFGLFKLLRLPEEGKSIADGGYYKGFWIRRRMF